MQKNVCCAGLLIPFEVKVVNELGLSIILQKWQNFIFCVASNSQKCDYQMQLLNTKYTKMHLQLGLRPGPHWKAYNTLPDPYLY